MRRACEYRLADRNRSTFASATLLCLFSFGAAAIPGLCLATFSSSQEATRAPSQSQTSGDRLAQARRAIAEADALALQETATSLDQAQKKYATAVAILEPHRAANPAASELSTIALISRGKVLNDLNQTDKAILCLKAALGAESSASVRALGLAELARSQLAKGDTASATAILGSALTATKAGNETATKLAVLKVRTNLAYELNDYASALGLAGEESALAERSSNRRDYVHALIITGLIQSDRDSDAAMNSYTRALSISREINYQGGIVDALTYIGHLHAKEGRLQQAIEYYANSELIARNLGDLLRQSWITSGQAYVYEQIGDPEQALVFYQRTLNLRLSIGNLPAEASIYRRLAAQYFALADYAHAKFYFEKAAGLYQRLQQPRYLGIVYRELGRLSEVSGSLVTARDYYSRAADLLRQADDSRSLAYLHTAMGGLAAKQKLYAEAEREYADALALHRALRDRRGEAEAVFRLGLMASSRGQTDRARQCLERALTIDENLRGEIQGAELRALQLADVRRHYEAYVDFLMQSSKGTGNNNDARLAFEASENARARSLLEMLAESSVDIRKGVDPALLERERTLAATLDEKARLLIAARTDGTRTSGNTKNEIDRLTSEYEELQGRIRAASPQYAAMPKSLPLTAPEIQKLLSPGTLLLEYMLTDERSYLWILSSKGLESFELPRKSVVEDLTRSVYEYLTVRNRTVAGETLGQRDVRIAKSDREFLAASQQLSNMLLRPVADQLNDKKLLIAADGALQYLPFAALVDPTDSDVLSGGAAKRSLAETHEIVSIPSASVIAVQRGQIALRPPASMGIAVFADPVFDRFDSRISGERTMTRSSSRGNSYGTAGVHPTQRETKFATGANSDSRSLIVRTLGRQRAGFGRLPYSRVEAQSILSFFPASQAFSALDFAANRDAATSDVLTKFRLIHFATHSYVDDEHPELSGILFSRFDRFGKAQNGYLELADIYRLKLPADLIVLSACETAVGKNIRGEGLMSLTRGFMYAGAARVVASLWKVDDAATAELMRQFYKEMFENGKRPAAALRAAQVYVSRQPAWSAPYYWASFVLQGEWE
jgi:CHAT domain-containing protein